MKVIFVCASGTMEKNCILCSLMRSSALWTLNVDGRASKEISGICSMLR